MARTPYRLPLLLLSLLLSLGPAPMAKAQTVVDQLDLAVSQEPWGESTGSSICSGTFTVQTQADLEMLEGCEVIDGSLFIKDPLEALDLTLLSSLREILGNLEITGEGAQVHLASVTGFANLLTVGGDLRIIKNNRITNLQGFGNLTSVGGDVVIQENGLTSLEGLGQIRSLHGSLIIRSNRELRSFGGVENLESVGGTVQITQNGRIAPPEFSDLTGFQSLSFVETDLLIGDNPSLKSLTGLESLETVGGNLRIYNNFNLREIGGCVNLVEVGGHFQITNGRLRNLRGFENLFSIGGDISITYSSIVSLDGLQGLHVVEGNLSIRDNSHLIDISALENLHVVGGHKDIHRNARLACPLFSLPFFPVYHSSYPIGLLIPCGIPGVASCEIEHEIVCQEDIDEFSNCEYLIGDLIIETTYAKLDFAPMRNIVQIIGDVVIVGNENLLSVRGFDSLTGISGNVLIEDNERLWDLSGFSNTTALKFPGTSPEFLKVDSHAL